MKKNIGLILLGLVLGCVLGYLVAQRPGSEPVPGARSEGEASRTVATPPGPDALAARAPRPNLRDEPRPSADRAGAPVEAALAPSPAGEDDRLRARAELDRLRIRVRELEQELALAELQRVARDGQAREMPPDLPPRFEQEQLRAALDGALREIGLRGQVTEIDCSEYPCLLSGELHEGQFGREESQQLSEAASLTAYRDDQRSGFGSSQVGTDGKEHHIFGVAIWPKSDEPGEQAAVRKRLGARWDEMREAAQSPGE